MGPGTPSLAVAVIARPGSRTLASCLQALRAAGVTEPDVVEIGEEGPAQARNRALDRCRAEVLAFVEDDVLVEPGWAAALAAPFADDLVAVAGGELVARVTGERPGWLSDPLLATFGLGAGDTFHGGNVAFRAPALRGAGGFWPARGDAGQRDWYSVEHEAQRELTRGGWRAVAVAEARAARVVDGAVGRREVLSRRLRTGARARCVGTAGRSPGGGAKSALGALAARGPARMERAARAADALGRTLGHRLVGAELEPVATRTPFRGSVPPPVARRTPRHTGPLVLIYHRIANGPPGLAVSPANFAQQLEILRATGRVVPFEHAGPGEIAVTFDDGYADNLVLREAGLPVTVFVTTRYVDERRAFWWDAVDRADVPEIVRLDDRAFLGSNRYPIKRYLQPMPLEAIDAHLRTLGDDGSVPPDDRPMTPEELRDLAAADHVTIGAHTRTHRSLRHAPAEDQHDEIAGSRDDIERLIGVRPTTFAYPYGVPGGDFDEVAVAAVRAAGFTAAAANAPMPSADRLTIPRHAVADVGGEEFARWLDGLR